MYTLNKEHAKRLESLLLFRKQSYELGNSTESSSVPSVWRNRLPQVSSAVPSIIKIAAHLKSISISHYAPNPGSMSNHKVKKDGWLDFAFIPAALRVQRSLFCLTFIGFRFLSACLSYLRPLTLEAEKWWKKIQTTVVNKIRILFDTELYPHYEIIRITNADPSGLAV
jgi:hypothetical protein